jgi:hypothetical protein
MHDAAYPHPYPGEGIGYSPPEYLYSPTSWKVNNSGKFADNKAPKIKPLATLPYGLQRR